MWLERTFQLQARGSTPRTEVLGGLTTFAAMAYICFVQPAFLQAAGMDPGAVLTATCLASALACFVMGLWANHPVALAPGMGLNAFFAFTVCGAMGVPWQEALGLVLVSGICFVLLGLVGLRQRIVSWVPTDLQHAIGAGIGLFVTFIGLKEAGVLVPDTATLVGVGGVGERARPVITALVGLMTVGVLSVRKVHGAVLLGIGASLATGLLLGVVHWQGLFAPPPSIAPTALQVSLTGLFTPERLGLVLLFLYSDLFDTVGTLVGVSRQAGLMEDGELPRGERAFLADALGTVSAGLLGTSTVTSYIESSAGVAVGARTGLASVVTGLCFLSVLVLEPLVQTVGAGLPVDIMVLTAAGPAAQTMWLHPVTAPALIWVGALMAQSLRHVRWEDPLRGVPAFLIVAGIPLTFSIADGISWGLIAASGLAIAAGKARSLPLPLHGLAALLALRWAWALAWGA